MRYQPHGGPASRPLYTAVLSRDKKGDLNGDFTATTSGTCEQPAILTAILAWHLGNFTKREIFDRCFQLYLIRSTCFQEIHGILVSHAGQKCLFIRLHRYRAKVAEKLAIKSPAIHTYDYCRSKIAVQIASLVARHWNRPCKSAFRLTVHHAIQ